jgi:hypothetical protein
MIKLVYVAGKCNGSNDWEVEENIWRAREAGARVVRCGAMPVVPHMNTARYGGLAPEEWFYSATMALLEGCQGILLLDGWERSKGARGEYERATELDLPSFTEQLYVELARWARS